MRSNETLILLQVMKQLSTEIAELRAGVRVVHDAVERIEQTGLTLNISGFGVGADLAPGGGEGTSESGSESESESEALSVQSAP